MAEMHNFSKDTQRAIEQMREMNKRATQPQSDDSAKPNIATANQKAKFNLNLFSEIFSQSDTLLLLGLILILADDNTDKLLLLALVYILS